MKILFISDIHGIDTNLKYIDNIMKKDNIDMLCCLGDLYYNYKYNVYDKVNEFLNKYKDNLICIKGNCDTNYDFSNNDFTVYNEIKSFNIDNIDIHLTHGHLYNDINKGNLNGVIIFGHKHIPYIKRENDTVYICVGSISLPRSSNQPTYVIYDKGVFSIYDINNKLLDSVSIKK